jgi:hypothetical protein
MVSQINPVDYFNVNPSREEVVKSTDVRPVMLSVSDNNNLNQVLLIIILIVLIIVAIELGVLIGQGRRD